jgi:hypothetical protein
LFVCIAKDDNTFCGGAVVKIIKNKCWILLLATNRTKSGIGETIISNICKHYSNHRRDIYVASDSTAKGFYEKSKFVEQPLQGKNIMMRPAILIKDDDATYWKENKRNKTQKYRQFNKARRLIKFSLPIEGPKSLKACKRILKKNKLRQKNGKPDIVSHNDKLGRLSHKD